MDCSTVLKVSSYCCITFYSVFLFSSYYELISFFSCKARSPFPQWQEFSLLIFYTTSIIIWFNRSIRLNDCSGKVKSTFCVLKVTCLLKYNPLLKHFLLLPLPSLDIVDTSFSITALTFWAPLKSELDKSLPPVILMCFAPCASSLQTHWETFLR